MRIICVMVASLNGFTTNGTSPYLHEWTSPEDQVYFAQQIDKATCIIAGRTTYEVVKNHIQHRPGRLRIILTSNPEKYKKEEIPGQLEFHSLKPHMLLKHLSSQGLHEALLVGGSTTNASFLKENLIDELWLTIEPVVFASGTPLFAAGVEKKLQLLSLEKLNTQGTLLVKYRFLKNGKNN